MKKTLTILTCLCFLSPPGWVLTFDECSANVMSKNPEIIKARESLKGSAYKRYEVFAGLLPSVSVNALYTRLSEAPPEIDFSGVMAGAKPNIAGNPLLQYVGQDNYSANLRVSQPIFTGFRNFNLYRMGRSEHGASQAEYALAEQKLKVETVRAFYGVLIAKEMQRLTDEAVKQLQSHLAKVEQFYKAGVATEYDFLKAQVQLLSWSPRVIRAEREVNNSLRQLNLLMGLPEDSSVQVEGKLEFSKSSGPGRVSEAEESALQNRPEMKLARSAKKLTDYNVNLKRSAMFPQVFFNYNYNFQDTKDGFSSDSEDWRKWWDAKVLVSWDVFSFGSNVAQIKEAATGRAKAAEEIRALSEKISMEVKDIYERKLEAEKAVELWKKNAELAQRGYEIANEKYNNGRMTNVDVLDSHVALIDAKLQYLKAMYEYRVIQAEFDRITAAGVK
ncbi:MAG: TolC family protein [Endomicrobiales bacterium]|nr:TolC family protein [Endomicrobiales bacterium]